MNAGPVERFDLPGLTLGEVVEFLRKGFHEGPYSRIAIESALRGNVLWCVEEVTHAAQTERRICAYVLETHGKLMGFKAYYEGRITHLTCPLSFLELAPERDVQWRESLRQMHGAERIPA